MIMLSLENPMNAHSFLAAIASTAFSFSTHQLVWLVAQFATHLSAHS
jgi:hypothetical protein